MSLILRRNRYNSVPNLFGNTFFNDAFWPMESRRHTPRNTTGFGAVDVDEHEDHYHINMDLPGLAKDDVTLAYNNGTLTISAERKNEKTAESDNCHCSERSFGTVERSFRLGKTVDSGKITASMENGVLSVRLGKREELAPKQISVD